jgi:carbon monoxide dehydrogenase subunit G
MELKGEYAIPAPRERVWAMLNDPAVLKACIPGCESLEGSPAEGFAARVTTKVGPVKATFNGAVTLSNVKAPESYTISGEGKGGVAGFAKGGADVHLADSDGGTLLTYAVNAQVGGKLAQLGSRLIDSTAKKLADQFFSCFAEKAGGGAPPSTAAADEESGPDVVIAPPGNPIATPLQTESPAELADPRTVEDQVEEAAREIEEEVEKKAAIGFLGGPMVWGLLVILVLLVIWAIAR